MQFQQDICNNLGILNDYTFGDFQLEIPWVKTGRLEHFANLFDQVRLQELLARKIYAEGQVAVVGIATLPLFHLTASLFQDPFAQVVDLPRIFSYRDEIRWRHQP